jgi:4-oxalocrotonate tautomerase
MPIVSIKTMKGALTEEQKSDLHKQIAEVLINIQGRGKSDFAKYVTVIIEEQEPENFSVAGNMATQDFVKRMTSV